MPEGEKLWGGPVVMVGIICPPPVGIGLTDLPNIGGASGPPSSGTTEAFSEVDHDDWYTPGLSGF